MCKNEVISWTTCCCLTAFMWWYPCALKWHTKAHLFTMTVEAVDSIDDEVVKAESRLYTNQPLDKEDSSILKNEMKK